MKILLAFFLSIGITQAATTGTLTLQGQIPQILNISVIPQDGSSNDGTYSGLDLTQNTNVAVANVLETSNALNGFRVRVTHDGKLTHQTQNQSFLNYTLSYGGQQVNAGTGIVVTDQAAGAYQANKTVQVVYTGSNALPEGTYSSTVTFTIEAR